jgi:hypothetical protein
VVDLSSGEEDDFSNISRGEEITRKLFGDLNCGLLGPPNDGNVIILGDSDEEEEEVCEDDCTDADVAPSSVVNFPTPIAFAAADDDLSDGVQDDSSGCGDEADTPYATTPKGRLQDWARKSLRVTMTFAPLHHGLFCKSEWEWWCRVIATFMPFMPPAVFVSVYVLVLSYVLKVVLLYKCNRISL